MCSSAGYLRREVVRVIKRTLVQAVCGYDHLVRSYGTSLAKIVQTSAIPYGLTLATWGSATAVQHFRGTPQLWEIFAFAAGGMIGYILAHLPITKHVRETGPAQPDARMALTGTLHLLAVGAAIGAAALLGKIPGWTAWPLAGFASILMYLLLSALEFRFAPGSDTKAE